MKIFTYPPFFNFLFKFGNIPITILLSMFLVPAVANLDRHLAFVLPTLLTAFLIYIINKHYLTSYSIVPYKIEADDEKLICTKFLFTQKKVEIKFKDISSLEGGIFEGRISGLMKVKDGVNNRTIGFYSKIKNAKELETLILSKVKKEVYLEVVETIKKKNNPDIEQKTKPPS